MPLTEKGKKVMRAMKTEYGSEKGKDVFYASRNKGTIKGVDPESTVRSPAHDGTEHKKKFWKKHKGS